MGRIALHPYFCMVPLAALAALAVDAGESAQRMVLLQTQARVHEDTEEVTPSRHDNHSAKKRLLRFDVDEDAETSGTAALWDKLFSDLRDVAEERRQGGLTPLLLLASQGCAGSSVVMRTTKHLLQSAGFDVYKAMNEMTMAEKNPYIVQYGEAQGLLKLAQEATRKKQVLLFKLGAEQRGGTDAVAKALSSLNPHVTVMLRKNVLDHIVCSVRDCFDKSTGSSVDTNGNKKKTCFKRRKGEDIKALIHTDKLAIEMRGELNARDRVVNRLGRQGFGDAKVFYFEDLMASEMDKTQLHSSTQEWQKMMSQFGFDLSHGVIRDFLSKQAGKYPAPKSQAASIYNFDDVSNALRSNKTLAQFLRP